VECIPKQRSAGEEAEQELDTKRSAERIDHVATLAAGRMCAKTDSEASGSPPDTSGMKMPMIDTSFWSPKNTKALA
jgi:hypothetical protein